MTIYTDLAGSIREATEQACELLGIAAADAVRRKLPLFFVENRHHLMELMGAAAAGLTMQMHTTVQGRRRRRVVVEIQRIGSANQNLLEWVLLPIESETAS